jgi:hypothetical protein
MDDNSRNSTEGSDDFTLERSRTMEACLLRAVQIREENQNLNRRLETTLRKLAEREADRENERLDAGRRFQELNDEINRLKAELDGAVQKEN